MSAYQVPARPGGVSFAQRLKAGDELLAVTTCNVHGKWGRRTIV